MKFIVGNWKMNGLLTESHDRATSLAALTRAAANPAYKMILCPPATALATVRAAIGGSPVALGAQDCHAAASGAHTGDISATMIKDAGCAYVIVGHSERRQNHGETDETVAAKAAAAHAAGLVAIICVGETDAERAAGMQDDVVGKQLRASIPAAATAENTIIAYEPVWAIGTGKSATADDVRAMHGYIHSLRPELNTLYGGSVKAENAKEILATPHVDGVLVGGASLVPDTFFAIAESA